MDKKFDFKIVEKGNCMLCKKELGKDDGIFICNSCKEKLKTPKIPSFDVGYDSPIKMYERQLQKDLENGIIEAVERVGIFVDRDELVKALHYDRKQYEKGYQDGLNADRWISVKGKLPEEKINENTQDFDWYYCATTFGDVRPYKYGKQIGHEKAHFWNGPGIMDEYVTHWMPKPEMPKS